MSDKKRKENYKGSLFDNLDMAYLACVLLCIVALVLFVIWVQSVDYSHLNKVTLEKLPPRVVKLLLPKKPDVEVAKPKDGATDPSKSKAPKEEAKQKEAENLAARIERAKESAQKNIAQAEERVTKANVLKILSGQGPGTKGRKLGKTLSAAGFDNFASLESKLAGLEGLTKVDAKKGKANLQGGGSKDAGLQTASISDLISGFDDAKISSLSKIGSLTFEEPEIVQNDRYTGSRDPQEIAGFISQKKRSITMLYEEMLKTEPGLEGKITIMFVIESDGKVSEARILSSETTLQNSRLHASILRRVERWSFPPAPGGAVEMKSPFIFRPA